MKTKILLSLAAMLLPAAAYALVMAPPPGPGKIARADTIVLGRIVAHEDKDIEIAQPGSPQKTKYRIAVLKVNEVIHGNKEAKQVRVAFYPPPPPPEPGKPIFRTGGGGRVNLDIGQDGMFVLTKHPQENFYQPPMYYNIVASINPNFDKELKETTRLCKLLDNPMAGLKSTDANERLQTAALLVFRYRTFLPGPTKQEPIDAEESKLIMKAMTEADWTQQRKFGQLHPQELFQQLGLTKDEGWVTPPQFTPQQFNQLALNWLRENGATYRIKRIVATK